MSPAMVTTMDVATRGFDAHGGSYRVGLSWFARLVLALLVCGVVASCRDSGPSSKADSEPIVAPTRAASSALAVRHLLSLPVSAYHASVTLDGGAAYILTPTMAYRLVGDQIDAKQAVPSDAPAVIAGDSPVFWADGALLRVEFDGTRRTLARATHAPKMLAGSRESLVWITDSPDGRSSIHGVVAGRSQVLYASPGVVTTLVLRGERVVFVEKTGDAWRLGRLSVSSSEPRFSEEKSSRPPAMIAVWLDEVYYYGGLSWGLRAASIDLKRERVLIKQFVCSPLAVFERIYCARVEGLDELSDAGDRIGQLRENRGRLITSIAADAERVVWISEAQAEHLDVEMVRR